MNKQDWIWMPHPGHLIVARYCEFSLNTYVGDYIVSTVGEYLPPEQVREIAATSRNIELKGRGDYRLADFMDKIGYVTIGHDRLYETMVFAAEKTDHECCPYRQVDGESVDFMGYNYADEARKGHYNLCEYWSGKSSLEKLD